MAGAGALDGDWLIADRQTAGRGRIGRSWVSPIGNLYCSGLIRLRQNDADVPALALVAAVAVYDAIAAHVPAVRLKWPNDVLAGDAKLSGILLERAADVVVVGIGVNLVTYPAGLDQSATSLAALGAVSPSPSAILDLIVDAMTNWVGRWRDGDLAGIRAAWLARAHPIGTPLTVRAPDDMVLRGRFAGLTAGCALQLRLADDTMHVIHAGDVFMI